MARSVPHGGRVDGGRVDRGEGRVNRGLIYLNWHMEGHVLCVELGSESGWGAKEMRVMDGGDCISAVICTQAGWPVGPDVRAMYDGPTRPVGLGRTRSHRVANKACKWRWLWATSFVGPSITRGAAGGRPWSAVAKEMKSKSCGPLIRGYG